MHEFSFASHIVDVLMENVKKYGVKRVRSVTVEVGAFTMIIPAFLTECYKIIAPNFEELASSTMDVQVVPGTVECQDCGTITEVPLNVPESLPGMSLPPMDPDMFGCSNCGGHNTTIVGGKQTTIKSMKVDE
jgi:hydrogenase nickel insertion protein HypA